MGKQQTKTLRNRGRFVQWLINEMAAQQKEGQPEGAYGLTQSYVLAEGSAHMQCSMSQVRNYLLAITSGKEPLFMWVAGKPKHLGGQKYGKTPKRLMLVEDARDAAAAQAKQDARDTLAAFEQ